MANDGFFLGEADFPGTFTFFGKFRALLARAGAAGLIFLALAPANPAAARSEIGPSSSAIVGISVSVAPKFGLRAAGPETRELAAKSAGLCIATNGELAVLPVLLVRSSPGQAEAAEQINWCDMGGGSAAEDLGHGSGGRGYKLVIIRPE